MELDAALSQEIHASDQDLAARHVRADAVAGDGLEAARLCDLEALFAGVGDDGAAEGVLRAELGRRRCCQRLVLGAGAAGRDDLGHPRFALGDGAGLVEDDGGYVLQGLDGRALSDEHAVLRAHAGAHHEGRGRCKSQCAGAGDNEHRDGRVEGEGACAHAGIDPRQELPGPGGNPAE